MSNSKPIKSALISVFNKDGLEPIVQQLEQLGVTIYSTGGTEKFINELGIITRTLLGWTRNSRVQEVKLSEIFSGEQHIWA